MAAEGIPFKKGKYFAESSPFTACPMSETKESDRVPSNSQADDTNERQSVNGAVPLPSSKANESLKYNRCQFYIPNKKRCCRMQAKLGLLYCAEHSLMSNNCESSARKRIPCPFDSRHSCYEDQLLKHQQKCASRPTLRPDYFSKNINLGQAGDDALADHKITLKDVPNDELCTLFERIKKSHKDNYTTDELFHPVLQDLADDPSSGAAAQKHLRQQASLIGHMDKMNLLTGNTSYVEFGAGKGGLSHWLQLAVKDEPNTHFLLVDKGSVRYKMDSFHKAGDQGPSFERLKIDIADLNLSKVESLHSERHLLAVGKHLCGGATDLMLRCLVETLIKKKEEGLCKLSGVVLALCCHHRCDWRTYVGKQYMTKLGFSPRDFLLLTRLTSWALCGIRPSQQTDTANKDAAVDSEDKAEFSKQRYSKLSADEREALGYMCKDIINEGRRDYLRHHGIDADLVAYVSPDRTPENKALLASCKNCSQANTASVT